MFLCGYVHASACKGQRLQVVEELELQYFVSCSLWALATELNSGPLKEQYSFLSDELFLQPLLLSYKTIYMYERFCPLGTLGGQKALDLLDLNPAPL